MTSTRPRPDFIRHWESGYKVVAGVKPESREAPLMFAVRRIYYKTIGRLSEVRQIQNFTGISSPCEPPEHPELRIDTGSQSLEDSVAQVLAYLAAQGVVPGAAPSAPPSPA
jgi:hypothetical protein